MKIKKKGELRRLLRTEGYDRIAIWKNGTWADVGTGYAGEQEGDNPSVYIQRSFHCNLTWEEIAEIVKERERDINIAER